MSAITDRDSEKSPLVSSKGPPSSRTDPETCHNKYGLDDSPQLSYMSPAEHHLDRTSTTSKRPSTRYRDSAAVTAEGTVGGRDGGGGTPEKVDREGRPAWGGGGLGGGRGGGGGEQRGEGGGRGKVGCGVGALREECGEEGLLSSATSASPNEIYHEDLQQQQSLKGTVTQPWWKSRLFFSGTPLFGAWDGVFTSCMINCFGVVVFLQTGWMVGNAGVGLSLVIVLITVGVALIAVLSVIGVSERCAIERGGIYSLLAHVLGCSVAVPVALFYCVGQAIACSLCVTAFCQSILDLIAVDNIWITRAISAAVLALLVGISVIGVEWVIGMQVLLLVLLFAAILDFIVGSLVHTDPNHGIVGYRWDVFVNNTSAQYSEGETFFTVFGVFFPSACGLFAGINMGGSLKNPTRDVPVGTLGALAVSASIYVLHVLILGATCLRHELQTSRMIAEKVSVTRFVWLLGMYELTLSSALGNIGGPPHILQTIAADRVVIIRGHHALAPLAQGHGAQQTPVVATLVFAAISLVFIFVGQLNTLGPILTMPFMLTYAAADYAYFALTVTYDNRRKHQQQQEQQQQSQSDVIVGRAEGGPVRYESTAAAAVGDGKQHRLATRSNDQKSDMTTTTDGYQRLSNSYSSSSCRSDDLDDLFPFERRRADFYCQQRPRSRGDIIDKSVNRRESFRQLQQQQQPVDVDRLRSMSVVNERTEIQNDNNEVDIAPRAVAAYNSDISPKTRLFYSFFFNRWLSLFGAVVSVAAMFAIQWVYAFVNIIGALILWFYIDRTCPGAFNGIADFSLWRSLWDGFLRCCGRGNCYIGDNSLGGGRFILSTPSVPLQFITSRQSEENPDFAQRDRIHHSATVIMKPNGFEPH